MWKKIDCESLDKLKTNDYAIHLIELLGIIQMN